MKNVKKLLAVVLAAAMVFAFSVTAFAQTEGTAAEGKGSISISNPSKGVEYKVYKIFDATVGTNGKINYTTDKNLSGVSTYFTADSAGNITATAAAKGEDGKLTKEAVEALATLKGNAETVKATSDGSTPLKFEGLDYGYYYVESSLGSAVSVDSTNPDAVITDKNSPNPHWDNDTPTNGKLVSKDGTNWVDSTSVKAGDTVTFKLDITSSNYAEGKQIANFIISDDLPEGLTFVSIKSVKVGDTTLTKDATTNGYTMTDRTATEGKFSITIPWVTTEGTEAAPTYTSKYDAGAKIEIQYTATLNGDNAVIAKTGNINEADFTWNYVDGTDPGPDMDIDTETATVYTYAFALKKVDQDGGNLAGATFTLPFYVKSTPDADDGAYVYAGTTEGTGLTKEVTSPANGLIVVKGLAEGDSVAVTEKTAPAGYNKIDTEFTIPVTSTSKELTTTTITKYIDADGNVTDTESATTKTVTITDDKIVIGSAQVVVNKAGQELPETGGMGTTIFYIVGAILVVGAGVVLITRRRMEVQ